ncbi:hypothetical protein [Longirhabdus pacifica]|uniref:hypothetical protein n=1 Tax=Longirhabdus pacifica TaxID=2305227 RepID=UPI001008B580|nr:hypothetical protein [Longirhabdus pacifica]
MVNPIQARYFNTITYDSTSGCITKRSTDEQKLKQEINWYLNLPSALHHYIPTIENYSLEDGNVFITMEYVPYQTLHETYLQHPDWDKKERFFSRLLSVYRDFSAYDEVSVTSTHLFEMYIEKTLTRLRKLLQQQAWAKAIYDKGKVVINHHPYPCPLTFLEQNQASLASLFRDPVPQLIHGDLCFSNLFTAEEGEKIIMIDPRGSFALPGIYGDGRYDVAKVRHSLSGYEHIISDRFYVMQHDNNMEYGICQHWEHKKWKEMWDELCPVPLHEIKVIESLLFLSMVPLHVDQPARQLVMYGLGTKLLYQALEQ